MPSAREGRARRRARALTVGVMYVCTGACADTSVGTRSASARAATARGASAPDGRPVRVVSLLPAASALLVAMGAADVVVGRAADDRTPALRDRPLAGTVIRGNPERIRALDPGLVVFAASTPNGHLTELLGPTVDMRPLELDRLDDVAARARELGSWIGRPAAGAVLADHIQSELDSLRRGRPWCHPAVVWAVGLTPPIAAGPGTLPDDLLDLAGATNVLGRALLPWPRPALEGLVASRADVLVWPVGGDLPPWDELGASSPWRRLDAATRGAVLEVRAELFHEAGPAVVRAARTLRAGLERYCPTPADPMPVDAVRVDLPSFPTSPPSCGRP